MIYTAAGIILIIMERTKNTAVSRVKSFSYAGNGIALLWKYEPNARVHAIATVAVIIAGFLKHISNMQWVAILAAIGMVWITEAFNTCIERLCDLYTGETLHPAVKVIKDIAAAAVLIAAVISLLIGLVLFIL